MSEYQEQDKDLRLLSYSLLVDKFNSKYKSLNESQKTEIKDEPSENELNNDSEEHLNGYIENVDEALENQENIVDSEDFLLVTYKLELFIVRAVLYPPFE